MIRKRSTGTEWVIPTIHDSWTDPALLSDWDSTALLSVVAACADMVKSMRAADDDLVFDFTNERVDYVARIVDFQTAGQFALDVLESRISDVSEKLADADKLNQVVVQWKKGEYKLPEFHDTWLSRDWIQKLDQSQLVELRQTITFLTGEMNIILANVGPETPTEIKVKIRTRRNEYKSALPLFETEINRRARVNGLKSRQEMFSVRVAPWTLSGQVSEVDPKELARALECIKEGQRELRKNPAQGWWSEPILKMYAEQKTDLLQAFHNIDLEQKKRKAVQEHVDGMIAEMANHPLIPVTGYTPSPQDIFFTALLEGKVNLIRNHNYTTITVVEGN